MKMSKMNFQELGKVMTEACFKGVEIKRSDFIEQNGVTYIEPESTKAQRILADFGFVTVG